MGKGIFVFVCEQFSVVLNMTVTAGIVILMVLLLRLFFRKTPKIFSYLLWSVVLFRLLCPISLSSSFSLLNVVEAPVAANGTIEYFPSMFAQTEAPVTIVSVPDIEGGTAGGGLPGQSGMPWGQEQEQPELSWGQRKEQSELPWGEQPEQSEMPWGQEPEQPELSWRQEQKQPELSWGQRLEQSLAEQLSRLTQEQEPSGGFSQGQVFGDGFSEGTVSQTVVAILPVIWIFGMGLFVVYSIISLVALHRKTAYSVRFRENIYLADNISSPFVFGFVRPKIYLPSFLGEEEREFIILHERHHIRRGDHVVKLIAFAALCLHWFNPLVWIAFILAGKDMEMSCDEAVMGKMDRDIRAEYSASLLHLATGRRIWAGYPLAFGEGDPKSRIKNVMNYKKPAFWVVAAAAAGCAAVGVCLLTNPRHVAAETDGEHRQETDGEHRQETDGENRQETDGEHGQEMEGEHGQETDGEHRQEADGKILDDGLEAKDTDSVGRGESGSNPTDLKENEETPVTVDIRDFYSTNWGYVNNLYTIDENGILWGSGYNEFGQLGQGTRDDDFHEKKQKIAEHVIHVDYSQSGFMVYLTQDHKLYGVGCAASGAMQEYEEVTPQMLLNPDPYYIATPKLLMENVVYARCGRYDVACLTEDNSVWIWGTVFRGRTKDYSNPYLADCILKPEKVLENAVLVTGGLYNHAALLADGSVWTWGANYAGNCGVEGEICVPRPTKVAEDVVMVWTDTLQYNVDEKEITDFDWLNKQGLENTIILKRDGTYHACGKGIGEEKTLGQYWEARDYTITCSSQFLMWVPLEARSE